MDNNKISNLLDGLTALATEPEEQTVETVSLPVTAEKNTNKWRKSKKAKALQTLPKTGSLPLSIERF